VTGPGSGADDGTTDDVVSGAIIVGDVVASGEACEPGDIGR
jgi:hypothetical protein